MVKLLADLKVAEIRRALAARHESTEGKKAELLQRLSDWIEDNDFDPDHYDFAVANVPQRKQSSDDFSNSEPELSIVEENEQASAAMDSEEREVQETHDNDDGPLARIADYESCEGVDSQCDNLQMNEGEVSLDELDFSEVEEVETGKKLVLRRDRTFLNELKNKGVPNQEADLRNWEISALSIVVQPVYSADGFEDHHFNVTEEIKPSGRGLRIKHSIERTDLFYHLNDSAEHRLDRQYIDALNELTSSETPKFCLPPKKELYSFIYQPNSGWKKPEKHEVKEHLRNYKIYEYPDFLQFSKCFVDDESHPLYRKYQKKKKLMTNSIFRRNIRDSASNFHRRYGNPFARSNIIEEPINRNFERSEEQRADEAKRVCVRGDDFYKKKDFDNAAKCYEKAVELDPGEMIYLTNCASCYFELAFSGKVKSFDRCRALELEAIRVGLENGEDVVDSYKGIAMCYEQEKNFDEAIKWYNKSLQAHHCDDLVQLVAELETEKRRVLSVAKMWFDGKIQEAARTENQTGANITYKDDATWRNLGRVAALCNRAVFLAGETGPIFERNTVGGVSESALLKFCEMMMGSVEGIRAKNPKICETPFNSSEKWQFSIHETSDQRYLLVMKGVPEQILSRCSRIMINGEEIEMTEDWKTKFTAAYETLGGMGERVRGFAHLYLDAAAYPKGFNFDTDAMNFPNGDLEQDPKSGLTFVGLMSFTGEEAQESVNQATLKRKQNHGDDGLINDSESDAGVGYALRGRKKKKKQRDSGAEPPAKSRFNPKHKSREFIDDDSSSDEDLNAKAHVQQQAMLSSISDEKTASSDQEEKKKQRDSENGQLVPLRFNPKHKSRDELEDGSSKSMADVECIFTPGASSFSPNPSPSPSPPPNFIYNQPRQLPTYQSAPRSFSNPNYSASMYTPNYGLPVPPLNVPFLQNFAFNPSLSPHHHPYAHFQQHYALNPSFPPQQHEPNRFAPPVKRQRYNTTKKGKKS